MTGICWWKVYGKHNIMGRWTYGSVFSEFTGGSLYVLSVWGWPGRRLF